MESQLFTKLLPKEVAFFRGESPSPEKLNGAFGQISSAFYILESFLGNGLDYKIDDPERRKMLYNVSSALGRTDRLYKITNKIPNLKRISDRYVTTELVGSYSEGTEALTLVASIVIPSEIRTGYEFGIYYKGSCAVTGINGLNQSTLPTNAGTFGWYRTDVLQDMEYLSIGPSGQDLEIKALYISPKQIDGNVYNIAYSTPVTNSAYWIVKTPCRYSNPASGNNNERCASKTCDYCIGNTYGYNKSTPSTYGLPVCNGALDLDGNPISYTSETGNTRASYLTIQSPLNTTESPYAVKLAPYYFHDIAKDIQMPKNYCMLYDIADAVNPIKYDCLLYSAGGVGGEIRGDIFYAVNNGSIQVGDNNRYLVLGGNYGVLDLIYDMLEFVERPIPTNAQLLGPAVYE